MQKDKKVLAVLVGAAVLAGGLALLSSWLRKKEQKQSCCASKGGSSEMKNATSLVMYGEEWCPDCVRSKKFLKQHNVPFTVIPGRPDFGTGRIPTIVFPDQSYLTEPSDAELEAKCKEFKLL
eukprot:g1531.t1